MNLETMIVSVDILHCYSLIMISWGICDPGCLVVLAGLSLHLIAFCLLT